MVGRCVTMALGGFEMAVDLGVCGVQCRLLVRRCGTLVRALGIEVAAHRIMVGPLRAGQCVRGIVAGLPGGLDSDGHTPAQRVAPFA